MKRLWYMGFLFLMTLSLVAGCASMPGLKKSTTQDSASKSSSSTKKEGLYSQVPAALRAPVKEAEFDLKEAKAKAEIARERVKLTDLQKERALLEVKWADYGIKFAEISEKAAELAVEIRTLEAIDNANLGDKERNIKDIANLKTKRLGLESEGIQVKADFDTTELKIKKLTKDIESQSTRVQNMENKKPQETAETKAETSTKPTTKSSTRKRKTR
jgi:hypothetical protein